MTRKKKKVLGFNEGGKREREKKIKSRDSKMGNCRVYEVTAGIDI